jgi:DNA-binding beta-propeller fold protein YncE
VLLKVFGLIFMFRFSEQVTPSRTVKNALSAVAFNILLFILPVPGHSQSRPDPLRLVQTISIPGVEGRFDHLAVDLKGKRLFLAAQKHRTVEVVDLAEGKRIHSIGNIGEPHAERYLPASNELLVSIGDEAEGALKILNGTTFETLATFKILVDADGIAFDPATQYVYIENGGKDAGNNEYCLVSVIDTAHRKNIGDIRVNGAELEAMAVERSGTRLFVNMKTLKQVGIVDRNKLQVVSTWPIPEAGVNTPLALDETHHRLFVGAREPAEVVVFDTDTGKVIAKVPCVGEADDMFYDEARKRIYVTGDEGFISVIAQTDADHYEPMAKLKTRPGARNSLFVPELGRFFVTAPSEGQKGAELLVFQVEP